MAWKCLQPLRLWCSKIFTKVWYFLESWNPNLVFEKQTFNIDEFVFFRKLQFIHLFCKMACANYMGQKGVACCQLQFWLLLLMSMHCGPNIKHFFRNLNLSNVGMVLSVVCSLFSSGLYSFSKMFFHFSFECRTALFLFCLIFHFCTCVEGVLQV